jgi:transposase
LAEYGIVVAQGVARLRRALPTILEDATNGVPTLARRVFAERASRLMELDASIATYDQHLATLAHASPAAQRLCQLGGVGPITATAVVATIGDGKTFRNGRQFAAWLGLTPRQHSSGGKTRLGRISKRGDVYLRTLLIHGTRAVLRVSAKSPDAKSQWAERLKARRGANVAAVALAAKHARIMWALLARDQDYRVAA